LFNHLRVWFSQNIHAMPVISVLVVTDLRS
jgi:hypothetical protein